MLIINMIWFFHFTFYLVNLDIIKIILKKLQTKTYKILNTLNKVTQIILYIINKTIPLKNSLEI